MSRANRPDLRIFLVLVFGWVIGCTSVEEKLYTAASQGDIKTLHECIEAGVDVNQRIETSTDSALHAATLKENQEAMELLVEAGADFAFDEGGYTPLHRAVAQGLKSSAEKLIELGADVNRGTEYNGETPLHLAVIHDRPEMVELLIAHGADVNAPDDGKFKEPPLLKAADLNRFRIAEILLDHGADPNLGGSDQATPLHMAAGWGTAAQASENRGKGLPDLVQLLLDSGADPNARACREVTPLHAAVANDLYDNVRILIENGALSLGNNKGEYPEDTAREKGFTHLLPLLEKAGTYASKGRMAVTPQTGHSDTVRRMKFSPDGSILATGGGDKKVCLWTPDGILLRKLPHPRGVKDIAFSPDGNRLVTVCDTESVFLWDVVTGMLLKEIPVKTPDEYDERGSVAFHPDGNLLAVGSNLGRITLIDLSGHVIKEFNAHRQFTFALAFSGDGTVLVSSGDDAKLKFWNTGDGSLIREENNHKAQQLVVSPDGRHFLSSEGMQLWTFQGECVRTLWSGFINHVAFSADGTLAIAVRRKSLIVKKTTGETVFETPEQEAYLYSCAFNPVGKRILAGSENGWMRIWNEKGEVLHTVRPETFSNWNLAVSPDKRHFAVCPSDIFEDNLDPSVKVWNLDGRLEKVIGPFDTDIRGLDYSRDGRYLFGAGGNHLYKWDIETGETIWALDYPQARSVSVGRDGDRIVLGTGISRNHAVLLDGEGKELAVLENEFYMDWPDIRPDGDLIATDHAYKVNLFDRNGGLRRTTDSMDRVVTDLCFSPDGQYLAVVGGDMRLFDGNGAYIRTIEDEAFFASPICVAFSPDSRLLAAGYDNGPIKVMDLEGNVRHTFEKHDGRVNHVAFTCDGSKVISVSGDGTTKIWSLNDEQHITLVSAGEEWIMYSDQGLFDSSRDGGRLVAMTKGKKAYAIDQFAARNNRPDLLLERMDLGSAELIAHYRSRYLKRLRRAGLDERMLKSSIHVPEARITRTQIHGNEIELGFVLNDSKCELKRYNLYVNDVPLFGARGKPVSGNEATLSERIRLTGGDNKIEVTCVNTAGAESFRAITYAECPAEGPGDLYFIGFGVSRYKDHELDLKYAHKDVLDLAAAFRGLQNSYKNVHIMTYIDEAVTRDAIRRAKENLMQADPNDTLVLFIAGHGVHDTDEEATYYFLTHDADLDDLPHTAAEFTLIEEALQGVPMRNKLFLMDTCESGEIEDAVRERFFVAAGGRGLNARAVRGLSGTKRIRENEAPPPRRTYLQNTDRYIYNDLVRRSGAIVFSACRGGEFSYENDKIENGLFTEVILDALSDGAGDVDHDGTLSVDELRSYVIGSVSERSGDLQHPTVDRDNIYLKFGFPMAGGHLDAGR